MPDLKLDGLLNAIDDYLRRAIKPFAHRLGEVEQRVASLETIAKDMPSDGGIHKQGLLYRKGAIVTHGGSAFIAQCDTREPIGGNPPSPDWRLFVQRGRDVR